MNVPVSDVRRALETERRRTIARLRALSADHAGMVEASRDSNADDEHDPEGATIAFERSQLATLVAATRARLDEVDAALARADEASYGVCEGCGRPIDPARLAARPTAVRCVTCAAPR